MPPAPPESRLPLADLAPPHDRSAQPGDGIWRRLGDAARGDRAAAEPPVLYETVLHPHPVSKWIQVTVVAIDLGRLDLHYVPGVADVKDTGVSPDALPGAPGAVPGAHLDRLVAVFNGGFKPRHGHWGMMSARVSLVEARADGCTVALLDDGSVAVRSWPALGERQAQLVSYRQTPPCLLERGEFHPDLERHVERAWGGHDPKRKTRRRSAVGIDESGSVLFYGMGDEAGPRELALAMKHAGAVDAAQLDINWSWTRFLLFGRSGPDAELQVTGTLIPKMVHQRTGYVRQPSERDFFYLVRAEGG